MKYKSGDEWREGWAEGGGYCLGKERLVNVTLSMYYICICCNS